jgi:hypothetical protein
MECSLLMYMLSAALVVPSRAQFYSKTRGDHNSADTGTMHSVPVSQPAEASLLNLKCSFSSQPPAREPLSKTL